MSHHLHAFAARTALLALLAATHSSAALAADPPGSEWVRFWPDEAGSTAARVAIDGDGNVYVASFVETPDLDLALAKYDAQGGLLWVTTYDGPGGGHDVPTDIAVTPEGVSVVGESLGERGPETVLIDFDASGAIIREHRMLGPDGAGFLRPQLEIGADGRRVVATDDNFGSCLVAAFASDGAMIFQSPFSFSGFSGASALALDATNDAYVVFVDGFARYVVMKLDPLGKEVWSHVEGSDLGLVLGDAHVAVLGDDDVVIAGSLEIPCVTVKARVWRHAADGTLLWRRELPEGGCAPGVTVGLVPAPGDGVYLAVRADHPESFLARLDGDGAVAWTSVAGGSDGTVSGFARLAATPEGSAVVTASTSPPEDFTAYDVDVRCYDASGALAWRTTFAGPAGMADFAEDVATGADGSIAVVATVRQSEVAQDTVTLRFGVACTGDLDADGAVGFADLLAVLAAWGPNPGHAADLDADGAVGFSDLLALLAAWGPCAA